MNDIDILNESMRKIGPVGKPGVSFIESLLGSDISEKEYQKYKDQAEKFGLIKPRKDGVLTELKQGFAKGGFQVLEGIGSTMEEAGLGSGLADWSRRVQRRNQQWNPHEGYSAMSLDPANIARSVGSGVAQSLGSIGAGMAATTVTGNPLVGSAVGIGLTFAQTYGDTVKEYREAMPDQDESTIKGLAFLSSAVESVIEMGFGPEKEAFSSVARLVSREATHDVIKKFGKKAVMEFVKNGVEEGGEEILQSLTRAIVKSAGTHNLEVPPADQLAEEFMGGFWPGAVMGGGGTVLKTAIDNAKVSRAEQRGNDAALQTGELGDAQATPKGFTMDGPIPSENVSAAANQATSETVPDEKAFLSLSKLSPDTRFVPETKESLLANNSNTAQSEYGFFKETTDENGNAVREIHVNLQDPRGIEYVMGHEGFHDITSRSPELAKQIHDVIASGITKKNGKLTSEAQAMLDEVRRSYADLNLDENELNEEFDGNVLGACMRSSDFALSLAAELETRQKNSGVSFVKFVKDWLDKAIDWLAGREAAGEKLDDKTKALFSDYEKTRDQLVKLLADFTEGEYNKQDDARSALIGLIKNRVPSVAHHAAFEQENAQRAQEQAEGHRRAKEIAIKREQQQAAEVKADEQDAAKFMRESAARQEKVQKQQQKEADKALTDEMKKLQNAEVQEQKDIAANNKAAQEQSEAEEQAREAAARPLVGNLDKANAKVSNLVSRLDNLLMKTGAKVDAKFMEQTDKYLKAMESGIEQQDEQAVRTAADRITKAAKKFERTMRERAKKAKTKADTTMRVDEHVKWSKVAAPVPYYLKPFDQSVDEVMKNGRTDSVFVRETTQLMSELGFTKLPIMITANHIKSIYSPQVTKNDHNHNLGEDIKKLPEQLEHPLMVITSETKPNSSVVFLVEMTQKISNKDANVIVPILIDGKSNRDTINAHIMTSAYGRPNAFMKLVQNAITKEENGIPSVLYTDKKIEPILQTEGVQFSNGFKFGSILHTINDVGLLSSPQTKTLQFKDWFEDSQVIDADGNPLVVYRRDNELIDEYDFNKTQQNDAGWLGKGFYFYGDKNEAERAVGYGKYLRAFYLKAKNPYYITEEEYKELVDANDKEKSAEFTQRLIDDGYDSVYWNGDLRQEWVVFDPTQIKSATDNIGTFDGTNKKIHYSLVRQVNPIVTNGQVHDEYQSLLDTLQTTPFNLEKLEAKARAWFDRVGDNAFDMIRNQEEPGRDLGTVIRRMAMETEEFRQLPEEERREIMTRHIMEGSDWSHEGMARQMANRVIRTPEDAKRLFGRMKEKLDEKTYQKIRQNVLKETGIDIEALPKDIVEDHNRLDHILREAITTRASIGDKIYEYWINAILSAPGTHVTNTVGNVANLTYELTLKRIAEAGINRLAGRKDGATFGELKTMWRTLANKDVLRNAISVSRESFEQEVTKGGKFQESSGIAIGGKLGRAIRIPTRMLRAADEFAKAIIVPIETAAMAYREGTANGLSGEALNDYIGKQLKDPNSKAREFGAMRSLELTFQEKPGVAVDTLVALKTAGGFYGTVAKYLLPFIKTPANLLGQGVRKSPLGILNLAKEGIDIARGKRGFDNEVISHAAEQLIAWGGLMALMGIASDDDDDMPFITGSSIAPGSGERDFRSRNIPAYSIRIGDKWYSYQRIEPLATALAIIADGINTYRRAETTGDASGSLKEAFGGAMRLIGEKSYLQSIGEIVDLMQNPERSGSRWATDFVASWVPNAFRSASNSFDEYKQDTKVRSSGEQWWVDNFHVVMSKAGFERLAPKVDCFGREITREGAEDDGLVGWALRANLFATHRKDYGDMNEAEQLLWNWNVANPTEQYWPQVPNYRFKRGNASYVLTGEDYHDFAVDSGQLAYRQIQNAINHRVINVARPRENDIKIIKKIFEKARKVTREKYISSGRAEREE